MPSFSDAGDTDALLLDMYRMSQKSKKTSNLRLPGIPSGVSSVLSGAVNVVKSTASLPFTLVKAADVLHGFEMRKKGRKPQNQEFFKV